MANFPPFAGDAMERIVKDQKDFEKEHQFMQVYHILPFSLMTCFCVCFVLLLLGLSDIFKTVNIY